MTQQELEQYLWGAATYLRGTIDAGDYKQYTLPSNNLTMVNRSFLPQKIRHWCNSTEIGD
jgi:type I restriction-modification system DNA methylase subunit